MISASSRNNPSPAPPRDRHGPPLPAVAPAPLRSFSCLQKKHVRCACRLRQSRRRSRQTAHVRQPHFGKARYWRASHVLSSRTTSVTPFLRKKCSEPSSGLSSQPAQTGLRWRHSRREIDEPMWQKREAAHDLQRGGGVSSATTIRPLSSVSIQRRPLTSAISKMPSDSAWAERISVAGVSGRLGS